RHAVAHQPHADGVRPLRWKRSKLTGYRRLHCGPGPGRDEQSNYTIAMAILHWGFSMDPRVRGDDGNIDGFVLRSGRDPRNTAVNMDAFVLRSGRDPRNKAVSSSFSARSPISLAWSRLWPC